MRTIAAPLDFYGVNYYNPTRVAAPGSDLAKVAQAPSVEGVPFVLVELEGDHPRTDFGWPVVPDGLRDVLGGVQPGESVIVAPPAGLDDGDRVRARRGT